jgi:hypothetical protein
MSLQGTGRRLPGNRGGLRPEVRVRLRKSLRRGRGLVAAGLGPVLAAGTLMPVATTAVVAAGVAAVSVAKAPSAKASGGPSVLVLLQNSETTAAETTVLEAAGYTVISPAGTVTGSMSYDAWGNPSTAGGLTANTPFGYAGGYADPAGLVYLINRY